MYPKFGPGQLWEEVARQVQAMGGEIHLHQDVQAIHTARSRVLAIEATNSQTGQRSTFEGDYFFSTMPVSELIAGIKSPVPKTVKEVAAGLQYRDFITVGVLLQELAAPGKRPGEFQPLSLKDTWIYIQEKEVKVGRLQLFNNWSPYLVKDTGTTWLGMEYFCNKGDEFWNRTDEDIRQFAGEELEKIGLARQSAILDTVVIRMEKTYPAYFGTYENFDLVRDYTDSFPNLFLIGRNGMHKYNNSDHSMLTAMVAVDNICNGITDKSNIWSINTEQEYHEETPRRLGRRPIIRPGPLACRAEGPLSTTSIRLYFRRSPHHEHGRNDERLLLPDRLAFQLPEQQGSRFLSHLKSRLRDRRERWIQQHGGRKIGEPDYFHLPGYAQLQLLAGQVNTGHQLFHRSDHPIGSVGPAHKAGKDPVVDSRIIRAGDDIRSLPGQMVICHRLLIFFHSLMTDRQVRRDKQERHPPATAA